MRNFVTYPQCILIVAAALLLGGCSVAKDYHVSDGSNTRRSYSSVAGDVEVGSNATVRNAKTVSGDIRVERGSRTRNLSSVSGDVRLDEDVTVEGFIKTVAGDIEIGERCEISGDISTVAGAISISGSLVNGDIRLTAGDLTMAQTRVAGSVSVNNEGENVSGIATVEIGPGSEVGAVVADRPDRVSLRIHRSATVGDVGGIEVEYFD